MIILMHSVTFEDKITGSPPTLQKRTNNSRLLMFDVLCKDIFKKTKKKNKMNSKKIYSKSFFYIFIYSFSKLGMNYEINAGLMGFHARVIPIPPRI